MNDGRHLEFLRTRARVLLACVVALTVLACGGTSLRPAIAGRTFASMRIYDLHRGSYVDEAAMLEALDAEPLVFFGEQHATPAVQELELWLLQRLTTRHRNITLAMEHFQHDEQPVIDSYFAGSIDTAEFEKKSQPWKNYATYWKPLVEHMKSVARPVVALNVPDEALRTIYAAHPQRPLEVFNAWDASFKYAHAIAPRPLAPWDSVVYGTYFERDFDYEAHGSKLEMTRPEALTYFTDLAHIRDETMAYFTARASPHARMLVVAGDWHVQTGLALPDRVVRYLGATAHYALITTTPSAKLEATRTKQVAGRRVARFIFVYD